MARLLRGAVVVVAAVIVLLVPRLATRTLFFGDSDVRAPVAALLTGLALWTMPVLLVASWTAAGRMRLAHPWLLLPVGLFLAGAAVSTALASDKALALVRAAEMTGAWAAFFALVEALSDGADRRFLLGAVVATAAVSAGVALVQHEPKPPEAFAATLLLALPVAVALAVEKWRRIRTPGARGLAVVLAILALGLAAALVLHHGAWLRADAAGTWRAAAAMVLDRGLVGVGLENFSWHYLEYGPAAGEWSPLRPGNLWLAVGSEMGLAGLAAAVALVVLVVRAWCRRRAAPYAEGAGASLLMRLGPMVLLAAPVFIVFFPLGVRIGAGVLAGTAILLALASADSPSRLHLADRPLGPVRWGCIAALAAWWLYAQAAPIFLSASVAWPMLVVLAVSLDRRGEEGSPITAGVRLDPRLQFLVMVAVMAGYFGYVKWLLLPTVEEREWLAAAEEAETILDADEALHKAARASPLDWGPAWSEGFLWQREAGRSEGSPALLAIGKAIRAYTEATKRHPRLRDAYLALAECRLAVPGALGDREALQAVRENLARAAELAPTDVKTRLRLADVTDRLGEDAAALAEYRRALQLDAQAPPQCRLADDERQGVERRIGQLEESLEGTTGGSPG